MSVKRRLFTLAAALSLVLCIATCVLWVRMIWRPVDILLRPTTILERSYIVYTNDGRLSLLVAWDSAAGQRRETERELAGFRLIRREQIVLGQSSIAMEAPYWFWIIASGVLPLWWLQRARRERRRWRLREGRCLSCGYDM